MNTTEDSVITAGQPTSAQLESGIRDTRQRMDSTLDALGQRLSPRSLLNSAMDWWEDNKKIAAGRPVVKQAYHTLTRQVKNNPVPSLLIGAGVTWLLLNPEEVPKDGPVPRRGFSEEEDQEAPPWLRPNAENPDGGDFSPGILDTLKEKAGDAKDAVAGLVDSAEAKIQGVEDVANNAGQKAQHFMAHSRRASHELYDKGQDLTSKAGQQLNRGYDAGVSKIRDAVDDYPLAVGAACLALGALIGVLLPRTRREDGLLGRKSDELLEAAKEKGGEWLDQGKAVATEVGHKVLDEAKEKGMAPESAGDALGSLATKAGEVVRHAAEEAGSALYAAVDKLDPDGRNEAKKTG